MLASSLSSIPVRLAGAPQHIAPLIPKATFMLRASLMPKAAPTPRTALLPRAPVFQRTLLAQQRTIASSVPHMAKTIPKAPKPPKKTPKTANRTIRHTQAQDTRATTLTPERTSLETLKWGALIFITHATASFLATSLALWAFDPLGLYQENSQSEDCLPENSQRGTQWPTAETNEGEREKEVSQLRFDILQHKMELQKLEVELLRGRATHARVADGVGAESTRPYGRPSKGEKGSKWLKKDEERLDGIMRGIDVLKVVIQEKKARVGVTQDEDC